jgi:hypothetical protein
MYVRTRASKRGSPSELSHSPTVLEVDAAGSETVKSRCVSCVSCVCCLAKLAVQFWVVDSREAPVPSRGVSLATRDSSILETATPPCSSWRNLTKRTAAMPSPRGVRAGGVGTGRRY